MKRTLQNGLLSTDLDCGFHSLLRVGGFNPVPEPLVAFNDPRMTDARKPLDGSVTDFEVAIDAGIQQSKLNLNGVCPPNFLLTNSDDIVTTGMPANPFEPVTGDDGLNVITGAPVDASLYAARGDTTQFLSEKGVPNGYVPLNAFGRVPSGFWAAVGPGSGTVISVGLDVEGALMSVTPPAITQAGTFAVTWNNAPPYSWLGNHRDIHPAVPTFDTEPFPDSMLPDLPASKFTTGVFDLAVLPRARFAELVIPGVGTLNHQAGILPDPGELGDPADYLGRDMAYHTMQPPPNYEPTVQNPSITILYYRGGIAYVTISQNLIGASTFYRFNHTGVFQPFEDVFFVNPGVTVEAYSARIGYNNSAIVSLLIPHEP